jgi:hypothetical protein
MKAAILVNGECRELPIAIKTWRFLNEIDCDVYVSTWNKSKQVNKNLNIDIEEDITEEYIKQYIPNAKISIKNKNDYDFSSDTFYHNAKQIFHWKNSLKMMKESGIEYDIILMTRPDNYMFYNFHSSKFFEFINEQTLYGLLAINVSGPNKQYFVLDYFFCGLNSEITKFIESLPDEMPNNIHTELSLHILSLDMYVHPIQSFDSFDLTLARPTLRGIENLTREIVQNKFWEWGQNNLNK